MDEQITGTDIMPAVDEQKNVAHVLPCPPRDIHGVRWRLCVLQMKKEAMFAEIDAVAEKFVDCKNDAANSVLAAPRCHDEEADTSMDAADSEESIIWEATA